MANGDVEKYDYIWKMKWNKFVNNYILFQERRKEIAKDLERSKSYEEITVKLLKYQIFK